VPSLCSRSSSGPARRPGCTCTAGTLTNLAADAEIAVTIAGSGAIPSLVGLGTDAPVQVQHNAAGALGRLAAGAAVVITAAGAIPALERLMQPESDDIPKLTASRVLAALRGPVGDDGDAEEEGGPGLDHPCDAGVRRQLMCTIA
jgi:hypothetical protein